MLHCSTLRCIKLVHSLDKVRVRKALRGSDLEQLILSSQCCTISHLERTKPLPRWRFWHVKFSIFVIMTLGSRKACMKAPGIHNNQRFVTLLCLFPIHLSLMKQRYKRMSFIMNCCSWCFVLVLLKQRDGFHMRPDLQTAPWSAPSLMSSPSI